MINFENPKEIIKILEASKLVLASDAVFNKKLSLKEIKRINTSIDKINKLIEFIKQQKKGVN